MSESAVEKETFSGTKLKTYPIAEIFTSPQGEGLYTGTLMTFVRFAGCSVGKKLTADEKDSWRRQVQSFVGNELLWSVGFSQSKELPVYTEKCCTYDGRSFLCDTDFRTKEVLTPDEIVKRIPEGVAHVCLTGGEPLIHDLLPLIAAVRAHYDDQKPYDVLSVLRSEVRIHIETSGTVDVPNTWDLDAGDIWITVSPKFGVLDDVIDLADEIKILVDENFDEEKLPESIKQREVLFIQPINAEFTIDDKNMKRVLDLQKKHPLWRISSQMHKVWKVR